MKRFNLYLTEAENTFGALAKKDYGQELILDIHNVPPEFFKRKQIRRFAEKMCEEIKMKKGPLYLWGKDEDEGKAKTGDDNIKDDGISCVQFLYNSSITIHAIDEIQKVFVNIFSCDTFDVKKARSFAEEHVGGTIVATQNIIRK